MERLDKDRHEDPGMEGYVFRVQINKRQYALKVFKDFDMEPGRFYWEAYMGSDYTSDVVAYYTDPFFSECRAYGRIQDALDNKALAANPAMPCYGYILLQQKDEEILLEKGLNLRHDLTDSDTEEQTPEKSPIRALVKKLASPASGVTTRRQAKICMDLLKLNELQIYNRDIRAENYRDGLLVDFGSSITLPHILMDAFGAREREETLLKDGAMFKGMLDREGIKLKVDPTVPTGPRMTLRKRANAKGKT
ncbi:hypothetical protein HJFPF1_09749 [Paramyrothecium foliicola]|nr:hypothetical protein HJFPF1_09749 [Paramyrothecium foliicola]